MTFSNQQSRASEQATDRPKAPFELTEYLATHADIAAPVATVWPMFLDMNRWYTDYHWDSLSGPDYGSVGLQEGQVLKTTPRYGVGLADPTLFFYQKQVKLVKESQIVVMLTAHDPKALSADYGTEVLDLVAFYHWDFKGDGERTRIDIRSYSHIQLIAPPDPDTVLALERGFFGSWGKCLGQLAELAESRGADRFRVTPQ